MMYCPEKNALEKKNLVASFFKKLKSQTEVQLKKSALNLSLFSLKFFFFSETALPGNSKNNSTNMTVRNDILIDSDC